MDPPELASAVTAADRELTADDAFADADLHPGPDRVNVRWVLRDAERDPVAHRARPRGIARSDVSPQPHRRAVVDLDEVEQPIEVEIGERCPSSSIEAQDAGGIGGLVERPIRLPEEKIARVPLRVLGLRGDVAFGDEEIDETVVVDVRELVVPGRGRPGIATGERLGGVDPALQPDVAIGRM